jgi:uncharacterized protein YfkK (UPF0435 family)
MLIKKTNNNELKNWLYNNLGNIYCLIKKNTKRDLLLSKVTITAKELRIQYKLFYKT